jgi:hypothetical protein
MTGTLDSAPRTTAPRATLLGMCGYHWLVIAAGWAGFDAAAARFFIIETRDRPLST